MSSFIEIIQKLSDHIDHLLKLLENPITDINEYMETANGTHKHTMLSWFVDTPYMFNLSNPQALDVIKRMHSLGADLNKPTWHYSRKRYAVQLVKQDYPSVRQLLLDLGATKYIDCDDIARSPTLLQEVIDGKSVMSENIDMLVKVSPGSYGKYVTVLDIYRGTPYETQVRQIMSVQGVKEPISIHTFDGLKVEALVVTLQRIVDGQAVLEQPINTPCRAGSTLLERLKLREEISNPAKRDLLAQAIVLVEKLST
jgi:hypothetical protein